MTTPQDGQECCSERSVERDSVGGGRGAVIVMVALMAGTRVDVRGGLSLSLSAKSWPQR